MHNEATIAGTFRINSYLSSKGRTLPCPLILIISTRRRISKILLTQAFPDLMRQILADFINQILLGPSR